MSIEDIVEGIEDKANTITDSATHGVDSIFLREATSTITKITSALLGVFVTIILILVPIMVSLEVTYIVFPFFRDKMDRVIEKMKTGGVAKRTVEFTFRDAIQAIIQAETAETGMSALWIYFKIKCKSILFIVFMVSLVMLGSGTIINFVANLFSGLFDIIFSLVA